jgi:hypothetical protein
MSQSDAVTRRRRGRGTVRSPRRAPPGRRSTGPHFSCPQTLDPGADTTHGRKPLRRRHRQDRRAHPLAAAAHNLGPPSRDARRSSAPGPLAAITGSTSVGFTRWRRVWPKCAVAAGISLPPRSTRPMGTMVTASRSSFTAQPLATAARTLGRGRIGRRWVCTQISAARTDGPLFATA